ncbi:MAG TPA: RluA family pseudouridine synthase, partial [Thermoanaerobaculia bacterium]|nr:RluA family pseudouridine synthase [Thermoanaerobaculia bacterium]
MRLDQVIPQRYPELSRRKARELIAQKRVLVNERLVAVASREVSESDRIAIVETLPEIPIIKETADWIAVDKPAGMPTQPTRDRKERSLEELLRVRFRSIYLVHRIDAGTSGVVVFARNRETAARLSELFATRAVRKTYLAVIDGTIDRETTIDDPIDGKEAITIVRPLRGSLVEVEIRTGRMHQIRVHLASIGHAVVGDTKYGGARAHRLMLHAWKLAHDELGELIAPPPAEF